MCHVLRGSSDRWHNQLQQQLFSSSGQNLPARNRLLQNALASAAPPSAAAAATSVVVYVAGIALAHMAAAEDVAQQQLLLQPLLVGWCDAAPQHLHS